MGKGSKTKTTTNERATSTTTGLEAAQPALQSLLDQVSGRIGTAGLSPVETAALSGLAATAGTGTEFTPQVRGLISDLFQGGGFGAGRDLVTTNADLLSQALTPTARGDFTDPTSDPVLQAALTRAQDDTVNRIRSQFSAGGRSFSPAESRAVGEGIADVTARTLLSERARQQDRQFGALDRLVSGGVTTANVLDTLAGNQLGARQGAIGLLPQLTGLAEQPFRTQFEVEQLRQNTPLNRFGLLSNILTSIAGTGSAAQRTGTSTSVTRARKDPIDQILRAGEVAAKLGVSV